MSNAYIFGQIEVHDKEGYKEYLSRVTDIVRAHGGRYLARGGRSEVLEGNSGKQRYVLIEFESMDAARIFYRSEDYQAIIRYRQAASHGTLVLVEGLG